MILAMTFVQTGSAKPTCVSKRSLCCARDALPLRTQLRMDHADRWWMVECGSADEGRETIRNATGAILHGQMVTTGPGRIVRYGVRR